MSNKRNPNVGIDPSTPNKLTMMRICLIPVFVFLFETGHILRYNYLSAFIIFAAASITDWLDGHLARKYNLVSDFGKLMDPLADKVLVTAAMICFVGDNLVPTWVVIVIVAREFLVTSIRLIAASKGMVLAADKWGKYKTATTMVWLCYGMLLFQAIVEAWIPVSLIWPGMTLYYLLMALTLFFTVYSGIHYVRKNRELLSPRVEGYDYGDEEDTEI